MSVQTQPLARPARRIPPPAADKEVLKVNIYEHMRHGNSQLLPLFPYLGEGDCVPCGAILRGEADADWGHFFHWNTVDEVVTVFGGDGGLMQTGQVFATQKLHGVNSFLKDPGNDASYLVLTITQRQSVAEPQREAIIMRCGKCAEQLVRFDYDAPPLVPSAARPADADAHPAFLTIVQSWEVLDRYNADPAQRHCAKCGADNPPFPLERWGWGRYSRQSETVNAARRALDAAAREHLG